MLTTKVKIELSNNVNIFILVGQNIFKRPNIYNFPQFQAHTLILTSFFDSL